MRKILFSVGVFEKNDYRYNIFNNQIKNRNQEYCNIHGYEYLHIEQVPLFRDHYSWSRLKLANEIILQLSDGDVLINLDADMCIVDGRYPFQSSKSFGYSIDTGNSHCLGSWTLNVNDWSRKLLQTLIDDKLYLKLKNDQLVEVWKEQGILYYILGIKKPIDDTSHFLCFLNKTDYGFNEFDYGYSLYNTSDLISNINIFDSNWNVSYTEGKFFICKNKSVIIRHWGGGQKWESNLYNTQIIR